MQGTLTQKSVAAALLNIGAVGFSPDKPVTFKMGIISPVYVDNRIFPFHPKEWATVIHGFGELLDQIAGDYVIAGVETAGIPHSAALGYYLDKPSVFVRKKPKDHGTKKLVEGGDVNGRNVVLVEDLVSTGDSSVTGIGSLRAEGATVEHCLVIVTYGFEEAETAFREAGVNLHPLTTFPVILEQAVELGKIDAATRITVEDWLKDPYGWAAKNGHA